MNKKQSKSNQRSMTPQNFDVAIVGMSCRFPGAKRYRYLWSNLVNGVNSITEVPKDRWDIEKYYSPDFSAPGKSISKWGGFLDDIDHFDNRFFNISPREAKNMDPQQRVLLEETWKCIEDSGISLSVLSSKMTSVYVGVMAMDYYQSSLVSSVVTDSFSAAGNYSCIIANRISYYYGFRGVSMTLDTACSSSLVAMNAARRELYLGESDYILITGVSLNYSPFKYISFSKSRMLSSDGQCKTFDKDANGYVPGEGVGVLLLQPLDDAIEDGNNILGVLKGSSCNHVGRSVSMTAPRVEAQTDLILSAYENAGVDPATVNYIEAHGTGTSLGDPIEVEGLTRAFRQFTEKTGYCKIGSIKTNIGHLEAAAGIAGVIKVLLMMKYKKIPPTLNIKTLNPIIDFVNSPFQPATELEEWKAIGDNPRRAGISSFGFGGVNSHIVLEEYIAKESEEEEIEDNNEEEDFPIEIKSEETISNRIFTLSAKTKLSLEQILVGWKYYVNSEDFQSFNLDEICQTLKLGREVFKYRYAIVVNNKNELKNALLSESTSTYIYSKRFENYLNSQKKDLVLQIGDPGKITLSYFTNLYEKDAHYRKAFNRCKTAISEITFLNVLHSDPEAQEKYRNLYSFSIVYSLVSMIIHSGVHPKVICGEGVGQWIALCISGVVGLKDCLLGILNRNHLKNIALRRPKWPLYLQSHDITIHPFYFDNQYKQHLIKDVRISDGLIHSYIHKANLLLTCQFTFKKLMEEWNNQFSVKESVNLYELLKNDKWWENSSEATEYNKTLLLVIILSCLRSLNRKWNLTENLPNLSPGVYELLDLISDKLITQREVIQLLQPGFIEFAELADRVHSRQADLDLNKPYEFLREINVYIRELENHRNWIDKIGEQPIETEEFNNSITVDIGAFEKRRNGENHLKVPLNKHIERNLSEAIMELWLRGVDINWKNYSRIKKRQKVSALPVYFFDQKSFWVEQKKEEKDKVLAANNNESSVNGRNVNIAPLVKATDTSNRFTRLFEHSKCQIIQDHRITSAHIVPGASMIELALDGFRRASKGNASVLLDVTIKKPGIVHTKNELSVIINREESCFDIISEENSLCFGKFGKRGLKKRSYIDPDSLKTKVQGNNKIYGFFENAGYHYGKTLRVIHGVHHGDDYTSVELFSAESIEGLETCFDPCLLDGVFQSMLLIGEQKKKIFAKNSLFVPYHIKTMTIHGPLENHCYVLLEDQSIRTKGADLEIDAEVYGKSGDLILQIENMTLKQVHADFLRSKAPKKEIQENPRSITPKKEIQENPGSKSPEKEIQEKKNLSKTILERKKSDDLLLFSPVWIPSYEQRKMVWGRDKVVLIFQGQGVIGNALAAILERRGNNPILIQSSDSYKKISPSIYQINYDDENDYIKLFKELKNDHKSLQDNSVYLFYTPTFSVMKTSGISLDDMKRREIRERKGIYPLFYMSKALTRTSLRENLHLVIPTLDCFVTSEEDTGLGFMHGGTSGLARVLELEKRKVSVKQIDFSSQEKQSINKICDIILNESSLMDNELSIAIRNGKKYVRKIKKVEQVNRVHEQILKDGGTYVIIGGLGGLGLKMTKDIVAKVKANIILMGRSTLSPQKEDILKGLASNGSNIDYCSVDICDFENLNKNIEKYRRKYGSLNGIIHSGGILEDKLITSKEVDSFRRVTEPKVLGAWNLDKVTKDDDLDFFMVFSSITSVIGNFGQVDYASANAFLDHFIQYRKQRGGKGHSISINWTLWNDGGMGSESQAIIKQLDSRGIKPLPDQLGIEATDHILNGDLNQVIVLFEEFERIKWEMLDS